MEHEQIPLVGSIEDYESSDEDSGLRYNTDTGETIAELDSDPLEFERRPDQPEPE